MKKLLLFLCTVLLTAACLLSACDTETDGESSTPMQSQSFAESTAESTEEVSSEEAGTDESVPEDAVKLLFARYTDKPQFVMIGTCAQGAVVTAQIGEQTVSVPSYMGWFAVTMENKDGSSRPEVTFTQAVDGEPYDIARTETALIRTPENLGTTAFASNEAFQFFLAKMIPDFEGNGLYSNGDISNMKNRVKNRLEQLRSYNDGAEIIYMIVPSPMTIYPELVPEQYKQNTGETRLDQVTTALTEAGATVIDVRDLFREHKNDEMPLYYHLDSHWADYGAYLAYTQMFEHIAQKFPEAAPRPITDFKWTADYYTSADAMLYLGINQADVKEYGYFREFNFKDPANITEVPRYRGMQLIYNDMTTYEMRFDTGRSELPSCVVYRDSYCAGIYDLIPERMNKTHYMGMWGYGWNNSVMASEKPDYVIYILAEWNSFEIVYN